MALEGLRKRFKNIEKIEKTKEDFDLEVERYYKLRADFNREIDKLHNKVEGALLSMIDRELRVLLRKAGIPHKEQTSFPLKRRPNVLYRDCYIHACQSNSSEVILGEGVTTPKKIIVCENGLRFTIDVNTITLTDSNSPEPIIIEVINMPNKQLDFGEAFKYYGQNAKDDPKRDDIRNSAIKEIQLIGQNYLVEASSLTTEELIKYIDMFEEAVNHVTSVTEKFEESSVLVSADKLLSVHYSYDDKMFTTIEQVIDHIYPA